ncbi:YggT family protein [Taylorella equigenitalis]|uniref:YggT family protein n=1 Tax=Taylorella equigenitalis TaxID=29575 RepID=UPI0006C43805|nr:YggT family protein [Taylorella equigenitalis]KOS59609.1 hypothetical protein AM589_01695 [Taylorella equigenitalis]
MTNALIFLIKVATSVFCALLFIRAWLHYLRVPSFNTYSKFIFNMTDFIVKPTQKILPLGDKVDWASMILALILCVLMAFIVTSLYLSGLDEHFRGQFSAMYIDPGHTILYGLSYCIQNFLSVILWVGVIYAILTWIKPEPPILPFIRTMMEPLLDPIRRNLPESLKSSPIDLSMFVLLVGVLLIQILIGQFI